MPSDEETCHYRSVVTADAVETVAATLAGLEDCLGTEFVDDEAERRSEAVELAHGAGTVVAYFERPNPEAAPDVRAEIDAALKPLAGVDWRIDACDRYTDEGWKESWKEYFEPLRLSARIGVGPPWSADEIPAPEGGGALVVEPGMAFGTGQHETTRLAAALLDRRLAEADTAPEVLDVGCGSGILSMVAARLGAKRVVSIDVDDEAISAARENAEQNELAGATEFSTTPLAEIDRDFAIVVANILAPTLLELADDLVGRVAPGGRLIVSGIPSERAASFLRQFPRESATMTAEFSEEGWAGYEFEVHAPPTHATNSASDVS